MPKGTFKPYLLYEMFTHEKAGFPRRFEESLPFLLDHIVFSKVNKLQVIDSDTFQDMEQPFYFVKLVLYSAS